jgi:vWA-MoxR associated protein C-terminal domain/Trypsin-like peptidase domain
LNTEDLAYPEADSWIASIHESQDDFRPIGAGIVLDERRILTCFHVIDGLEEKWVAFPKAADGASLIRREVDRVVLPDALAYIKDPAIGYVRDLAILVLAEPVPVGVTAAPLRFPGPVELAGKRWWAFGFPGHDPLGSSSGGWLGAALGYGWIRLYRESPDPVQGGFSGGGLWCPDRQAVVAVVGQSDGERGGGRAITLYEADHWFPDQNLSALAARHPLPDAASAAPLAPEVAELAGQLAGRPHALDIIYEVLERTNAVAPPDASVPQLLARLHELVQPRGEAPWLQQVRELAAQRASGAAQGTVREAAGTDMASGDLCLLVAIHEDVYDPKTLRLSLTLFQGGQPGQPQECGNPSGSLRDMKEPLRGLLPAILGSRRGLPLVEFAVPQALLGEDFDQWLIPRRPGGAGTEDYRLGEKYPVVVRDVNRMNPRNVLVGDRDVWESRWKVLLACEAMAEDLLREADVQRETLHSLRASLWDSPAAGTAVLALLPAPGPASVKADRARKAVRELIKAGSDAGVPAAIWLRPAAPRKPCAAGADADVYEDDRTYLRNALYQADADLPGRPRDLPRRIWSLRLRAEAAQRDKSHPGRRLSLLWEDPTRSWTPPDLQLPSRSSNGDDL